MSADKKETLGLLLLLLTFAISAATYVIREGLAEGKQRHYEPLTLTLTLTPTPTPTPNQGPSFFSDGRVIPEMLNCSASLRSAALAYR